MVAACCHNAPVLDRTIKLRGALRWLHGERPTVREIFFVHAAGLGSAALAFGLIEGALLRRALAALLAWDVVGGVIANHTVSTSTWYRAQPASARYLFLVLHVAQPLLLGWIDHRPSGWGIALWATTLVVALIVENTKRAWQWPVGLFGSVAVCLTLWSVYKPSPLALWFAPAYALKVAAGFAADHQRRRAAKS